MRSLYRPPAPVPTSAHRALFRSLLRRERDLFGLLPREAYEMDIGKLGVSRRNIILVNDPALVRQVMVEDIDVYPKNDLMVESLEPLVGDGIFISSGEVWQRQRRMVDQAFTHMRINTAFRKMEAAVDDYQALLDGHAAAGTVFSLEAGMSHLTADIIYRTIFSRSLHGDLARDIFDTFARFQNAVATVEIARLLWGKPFAKIRQPAAVMADCARIRRHLGALIDERLDGKGEMRPDDLAADVIAARDPVSGDAFDREEIIDQIGVMFFAGHETTASVLTWVFFILSQAPEHATRIVEEVERETGGGPVTFETTKRLTYTRAVLRETLRLYPPLGFIPRVAARDMRLGGQFIKKGAMVMISPWIIHRHRDLWENADRFDPERFLGSREQGQAQGAYMPFGQGPRICVGAAFALVESVLILARLTRRYRFEPVAPDRVRPVSRLSTRPATEITGRVTLR